MAAGEVLIFRDARALASYLPGAAQAFPGLLARRCLALVLAAEGAAPDAPSPIALQLLEDGAAPGFPKPDPAQDRVRLVQAEVDLDAKRLRVVAPARGILRRTSVTETFTIVRALSRTNVVQAVPLEAWAREPEDPEVVFISPPGEAFAALVTEHLELGRDGLRYATTRDGMLLDVLHPSWFLLERWADARRAGRGSVLAYRRLPRRRIYVAWGKRHPLETLLPEPEGEALLFIDDEGRYRTLEATAFSDVGEILRLDASRLDAQALEAARDPGRIPVRLRLEGRPKPRDPELWLLPENERGRLERLLAQTPEEELKNLLVTLVARPDGRRFFVVREVLAGRAARLLPIGGQAYAALPGLPGLFCPCDRAIAPPLRNDRYTRAFAVKAGELTLLDERGEGAIEVSRLKEASFRPIDAVIDFVVDGDAARLEAIVASTPFELGRFAEEDLVPPAAAERKKKTAPAPAPPGPKDGPDDDTPERRDGLLQAIKGMSQTKETEPAPRAARGPLPAPESARKAAVTTLERELAQDPQDAARWVRLALARFEDKDEEEAVRSAENALWLARGAGEEAPLRTGLIERLGPGPDGGRRDGPPPGDAPSLYRAVFAFSRAAREPQDPETYRARTAQIHEHLRALEARLRKKTRWLAWREVLSVTGDKVEEERQREDVLSDLVLRGVEDREVPSFVRVRLLERYSSSQGGSQGAAEALEFLGEAVSFATATDKPAHRAAAIAHVAWAHAELGQAERARDLAQQAHKHAQEAKGEAEQAYRARALARAGAVLERTDGPNAGRKLFVDSLETIARGLESRPTRAAEERKAFPKWFMALADARAAQAQPDDPLVNAGLQRLEKIDPPARAIVLDEAAEALARLGQATRGRAMARALLSRSDLQLVHLEHAAVALETFEDGRPVVAEDGKRIFDVVRRAPTEVDEFTPPWLIVAFRADPRPASDVAEELAAALVKDGHRYAALNVKLTALRRLAELRDRERGTRLLAKTFEEAWEHPDEQKGEHRMRILVRLAQLIPAFGLRAQGLELLRRMKDRAATERLYKRNELLSACALAVVKLGETREAMRILDDVVEQSLALLREPRRDGQTHTYFVESLEAACWGAVEIGDTAWGLGLVERVVKAAREALAAKQQESRPGATDPGIFFWYRAITRCGKAAVALGDRDAAQRYFDDALTRIKETFGCDRIDLLDELAKAANELEGAARYELASRVLELAKGVLDLGEFSRQFAVDLAERVAQDVVKGESAFAAALKRWKGAEESRIRDRVVGEQVCS